MEYSKIIAVFITFFLGIAFTFFFKKREKNKETISEASKELANLSSDWYNQLHNILVTLHYEEEKRVKRDIYFYTQNRLILPNFIRSVEILKKHKDASKLVELSEKLLTVLTNFKKQEKIRSIQVVKNHHKQILCSSVYDKFIIELLEKDKCGANGMRSKQALIKYEITLGHIDYLIQNINREAGKLIG